MSPSDAKNILKANYSSIVQNLKEIRNEARNYRKNPGERCEDDPPDIDVRLYLRPDGTWDLQFGDGQYDQDHRGWCGVGGVGPDDTVSSLVATADDLIGQVVGAVGEDESAHLAGW